MKTRILSSFFLPQFSQKPIKEQTHRDDKSNWIDSDNEFKNPQRISALFTVCTQSNIFDLHRDGELREVAKGGRELREAERVGFFSKEKIRSRLVYLYDPMPDPNPKIRPET